MSEHDIHQHQVEPEPDEGPFVLIVGNPVDGFGFTGPFETHEEACEAGTTDYVDWWVAPLVKP